jgi:hypothetical protein
MLNDYFVLSSFVTRGILKSILRIFSDCATILSWLHLIVKIISLFIQEIILSLSHKNWHEVIPSGFITLFVENVPLRYTLEDGMEDSPLLNWNSCLSILSPYSVLNSFPPFHHLYCPLLLTNVLIISGRYHTCKTFITAHYSFSESWVVWQER